MSGQKLAGFTDGEGVAGPKGWNEENNEDDEEACEIDPDYLFAYDEKEHIYCEICHISLDGPKTFEAHLAGARHKKNVKNTELGAPVRPNKIYVPVLEMKDGKRVTWKPKCQDMIDTFDKPLIGLQFVTEWCHRNRFVEPRYYCSVCKAKCDVRMVTVHLTAVKHRVAYMKLFYPDMAARVREEGRKIDQAPLAEHFAKQIEEREGRKPLRVKVEGFPNCESNDDDDKELEDYIASNKMNFFRHLKDQGLPTLSEYWKSGGARGRHGSQPTMGSSGTSRSFSGVGFSGNHSASESGYDSMGPSGYQPSRPQMCNDSYQPQRSAFSESMSQSRPGYDEDSDCRGRLSADYSGGHCSPDFGGQSEGFGGQSEGFGGQSEGFGGQSEGFGGQSEGFGGQSEGFGGQSEGFGGQSEGFGGQSEGFGGQSRCFGEQSPGYAAQRGYQQGWYEGDTAFNRDRFQSGMATPSTNSSFKRLFPAYSDDLEPGPSYGVRGSRSYGRPYPVNRPSRFPAGDNLSEGHGGYQNRYW